MTLFLLMSDIGKDKIEVSMFSDADEIITTNFKLTDRLDAFRCGRSLAATYSSGKGHKDLEILTCIVCNGMQRTELKNHFDGTGKMVNRYFVETLTTAFRERIDEVA